MSDEQAAYLADEVPADEIPEAPPKRRPGRPRTREYTEDGRPIQPRPERQMKTAARNTKVWLRDMECVRMRLKEIPWDVIVEELGYSSRGHAHNRFATMMRQFPRDDVEQMRNQELDRIEQACAVLVQKILEGDRDSVRAAEVWNKLSERRARLMGLDKPERREVTVVTEDAVDRAIREAREEMERKATQAREVGIELPSMD